MGTAPYYTSYPCYVTLEDGTVLEPELERSYITKPEETYCIGCWEFDKPVDSETITSIEHGASRWMAKLES